MKMCINTTTEEAASCAENPLCN